MSDDANDDGKIENHTLVLLREIRDRLDRIEGTQAKHSNSLDAHSQTLDGHGKLLELLVKAVTAIDANQQKQTDILKDLAGQGRNHGARLNAMDGRLGIIEKRIGFISA